MFIELRELGAIIEASGLSIEWAGLVPAWIGCIGSRGSTWSETDGLSVADVCGRLTRLRSANCRGRVIILGDRSSNVSSTSTDVTIPCCLAANVGALETGIIALPSACTCAALLAAPTIFLGRDVLGDRELDARAWLAAPIILRCLATADGVGEYPGIVSGDGGCRVGVRLVMAERALGVYSLL